MNRNKVTVEQGQHATTFKVECAWPKGSAKPPTPETPTPEPPSTSFALFSIVVALFAATIIHALPLTSKIVIVTTIFVIAFLWLVRRVYRQDEERFNAQMNGERDNE